MIDASENNQGNKVSNYSPLPGHAIATKILFVSLEIADQKLLLAEEMTMNGETRRAGGNGTT